jgi:hypothetical protein
MLKQNLLDMCVVIKIIIFTSNYEAFIENNQEYNNIIDNPYYNL